MVGRDDFKMTAPELAWDATNAALQLQAYFDDYRDLLQALKFNTS